MKIKFSRARLDGHSGQGAEPIVMHTSHNPSGEMLHLSRLT